MSDKQRPMDEVVREWTSRKLSVSKDVASTLPTRIIDTLTADTQKGLQLLFEHLGRSLPSGKVKHWTEDLRRTTASCQQPASAAPEVTAQRNLRTILPAPGVTRERAERVLHMLDLEGIEKTMTDMTGVNAIPEGMPIKVYSDPHYELHQADLEVTYDFRAGYAARLQRLRYAPLECKGADSLRINANAVENMPAEMRGVLYHEFGHLWTMNIASAFHDRTNAYMEGFAELFRTAAAMHENADWQQTFGCNGYEVLHGPAHPRIIPRHEGEVDIPLANMGKNLVCNRLISLLGGLDERKLSAIAKVSVPTVYPVRAKPMKDLVESIERETGIPGFAEAFVQDPILSPGNMQTGVTAVAFPNRTGDAYYISCVDIKDPAPLYMHSRSLFTGNEQQLPPLTEEHIHCESVRTEHPTFKITVSHQLYDMHMTFEGTGQFDISARTIGKFGLQSQIRWPAGPVNVTFALAGHQPLQLQRTLIFTDEKLHPKL